MLTKRKMSFENSQNKRQKLEYSEEKNNLIQLYRNYIKYDRTLDKKNRLHSWFSTGKLSICDCGLTCTLENVPMFGCSEYFDF